MKAQGRTQRANGFASYTAVLTLLAAIVLSVVPFSAPALADPPRPPAARDDATRQRDAKRDQSIADELKRQAELQRTVRAAEANALQREVEREREVKRQTERLRHESLAAAARADRRPERAGGKKTPPTTSSAFPILLEVCNGSTPQEAFAPSGEGLLLIGNAWITKNRGLAQAFINGTSVEASIGGTPIANAGRFWSAPTLIDHPVLGAVWITRWEYPLTITTPAPVAVQVRLTFDHTLKDLVVFDEDGKAVRYPAGMSSALACVLVPAVAVSGRITGAGVGLADGHVVASSATGLPGGAAESDPSGEFRLLLRPGTYRFFFSSLGGPWVPEWWDDRASFTAATVVTLAFGVTPPRLNADLERGVVVSGRVTDAETHQGVPGVVVGAQRADVACCESFVATTDADGRYRMAVRKNVTLRVGFHPQPSGVPYVEQWWNGRSTFNEADLLVVGITDVANIDAALEHGVFVRGSVTDAATGLPLANAGVSASVIGTACCQNFFSSTNAQGEYAMAVHKNVSIIIGFFPPVSSVPYVPSYWDGRQSFSEADPLAVCTLDIGGINGALERGVFMRGRVTDALNGQGIGGAIVFASVVPCCESFFALTTSDGSYVTAVRQNINLRVQFIAPFASPIPYVTQWFNGRTTFGAADPVNVTTVDVERIDAALERGVFLRGRVTEAGTGNPIAQANVMVSRAGVLCCDNSFASTDARGDYAVVVRRNVSVIVAFTAPFGSTIPYLPQWYNGKPTFGTADPVAVGSTDVMGINAALERGVFVRGRVTDPETLEGIAGAGVLAFEAVACCTNTTFASTDSRGEYRLIARRNVALKINFSPPFRSAVPYIGQWYRAKASFQAADVVLVGSTDALGIDAVLDRGVFLSGRVTDAQSGGGLANAGVSAQRVDVLSCCETFFASTDTDGNYVMTVKRDVSVKVGFFPPFGDPIAHVGEWWNDRRSFQDADTLVIGNTDHTAINAALDRGVFVRGRVTDAASGSGLANAGVSAQRVDIPLCCESFFASTDANGNYAMVVRSGISIKINFFPPFNDPAGHVGEWWRDRASFQDADTLLIGNTDVSAIDAALERGVFLRGRVTDAVSGDGLANASVNAQRVDVLSCCETFFASTDADGRYVMTVKPGISVKVGFFPPFNDPVAHLAEWWSNRRSFQEADTLPIGASDANGIDAALERGVFVSGRVTDAETDRGVSDVFVNASVQGGACCESFFGFTNANGDYAMAVRPNVSVKIHFFPQPGTGLLQEFYNNTSDFSQATIVSVGVTAVSGINAELERGVRLSGTVTNLSGAPIAGVGVNVETATCCAFAAFTQTAADGTYSVVVRSGSYKVSFSPPFGSDLRFEYYNDKPNFGAADPVPVGAVAVTGINAVLEPVADTVRPLIVDARMSQNVITTDFVEPGDAFSLTFSEPMNTATLGATLFIVDQDGTAVRLNCGVAPNNVACVWDSLGEKVTITVDGVPLDVPAMGTPGGGTTQGIQIPFNYIGQGGFADLRGNLPDLAAPGNDLLVDFELP